MCTLTKLMKIIIPTAGWATRMRPQTWSKPKPLVSVAGRTVLDHLLEMFTSLPGKMDLEYVFILGPHLGETQIPPYLQEHHSGLKMHFVLQAVMKGQSDALWLAREHLSGPVLICFSDTILEADFSFLAGEQATALAWVKQVPDPRRFGVAEVDENGWVTRLVEKPLSLENNRVVVGCYYFPDGSQLLAAIEEQVRRGNALKGEFFLTDAINIMIEGGLQMSTRDVSVWLDTGTIEATLETNRYLLEHGRENAAAHCSDDANIIRPVFIHPDAQVANATIGPHVSIAAGCTITNTRLENSILEAGAVIDGIALKDSFVGRQARVFGHSPDDPPLSLNIGDNSLVMLK